MKLAFLFYEGMTALDAVGPHEILNGIDTPKRIYKQKFATLPWVI